MGKKAEADPTPEQRAVMAELREQLLKFPWRQTEEERERLQLIGEKLGLTRLSEQISRPRMEEQLPPEPTPKTRKPGGGRRPKFTAQQQQWLQKRYSRDLKKNRRLAKHGGAVPHVKELAETKYNIVAGNDTLLNQIIRPVLRAYYSMEK